MLLADSNGPMIAEPVPTPVAMPTVMETPVATESTMSTGTQPGTITPEAASTQAFNPSWIYVLLIVVALVVVGVVSALKSKK